MAKIQYKIRAKEAGKEVSLFMRFSDKRGIDATVKLPIKVNSSYWSNKTESFKQRIVFDEIFSEDEKNKIEDELINLKTYVFKRFNELLQCNDVFSKDWLLLTIDRHFNKVTEGNKPKDNLNQYIASFIKEAENGDRIYTHNNITKRYEKSTLKNFHGFKVQFDQYQQDKRVKLNYDSITLDFYDSFQKYFIKKNYSPNTFGRLVKTLKTIMRCAREEGLHNNMEIERKKFKSIKEKVSNIYLTESEVSRMLNFDFNTMTPEQIVFMQKNEITNKLQLEFARDVFLVGVYSLQRFSDYSRINPDHIKTRENGNRVIELIQKKTGESVTIPIKLELEAILKKYDYRLPKVFEQKVNRAIKVVGSFTDINEPTTIEETRGGLRISKTLPKYELIKTHTSRRTGCTLWYLGGVPTIDIMKVSGHKTEREFLNYIKVSKGETADNLAKHAYIMGIQMKIAR